MLSAGVVTILCHADGVFSTTHHGEVTHAFFREPAYPGDGDLLDTDIVGSLTGDHDVRGPRPVAEDDFATTDEEVPLTIDVLANDRRGSGDGDDDDDDDDRDDYEIDRSTVDLDPDAGGRQSSLSRTEGVYTVDKNGFVTFTPRLDFFGTAGVQYTVYSKSGERSNRATLSLTVKNVNDAPVLKGWRHEPPSAKAGKPVTISIDDVSIADPDNHESGAFSLDILPGEGYSASANTVSPDAGVSGELPVTLQVNDGISDGVPATLTMQVTQDNVRPAITGQDPDPLTTAEDEGVTITLSHLIVSDPDNNYPNGFTIEIADGANYSVSGQIVTPAEDFSGPLTVPVKVNDGADDSDPYPLQVSVAEVNDAPLITGQAALKTAEETPLQIMLSHLSVDDPDNNYPEGFSLSILGGENYSVDGGAVTPSTDFSGVLTVPVFVNDGAANSEFFYLAITVQPVNDPPVITGQRALEITEGSSILLSVLDVTITDPDNTFPEDFSLIVQAGENYTFAGTTVTPFPEFTGTLTVNVVARDGADRSGTFGLQVMVLPQNDAPEITGQQAVTTPEDVSRTISLADLIVNDPDSEYPSGFSLVVFPGDNYTVSGNDVLPLKDFTGSLSVPVQVSDGVLTSNVFPLDVQVIPVNDPPIVTGQRLLQTDEDTPIRIRFSHLTVLDVDNEYPTGFTLIVSEGANYSVTGTTVTPIADFNGTLNVNLMVNDGTENSAPFAFQIQVGNADDAPLITGQTPLATDEETPVTLGLSHLIVQDPDNAYPGGFSLLVSPGVNYTVSGQTITPAVDFAGTLTVPVRVNDGINNSPTFDFQLEVSQVNDAPSFAPIANVQVPENAPPGSVTIRDISRGPMEEHQELTFVVTSGNTDIVEELAIQYNGTATKAVLSYVVKPNRAGVVTITVVAIDNGSNALPHRNSYASSFQIEVVEVNTAPTLDAIADMTLLEDAEQQHVTLTGITAGAGESQELSLSVTSNKPEFFGMLEVVYTSPETTGLLQFKPEADVFGKAQLSVTVTDNGSGVSPHANSITRSFTVEIQPVNDPPVFTSEPVVVAAINEEYEYGIRAADPDGEAITITAVVKPSWATLRAGDNGRATLRGKPGAGAVGNAAVTLQVKDASSTVEQSFGIYVNVRPVLTSLVMVTEEDNRVPLPATFFEGGYTDANNNPLAAIRITTLPVSGKLLNADLAVKVGDTIPVSSLHALTYLPNQHYFGPDFFGWNAFDGYHFSLASARVDISVISVNDPPRILLTNDTLHYEVNGDPGLVAPLADISDPDDDTLTQAVVGFHARNYFPQLDVLEFENRSGITGNFDFQSGILRLTGKAPVSEYRLALRAVRYLHRNSIDPLLEPKALYFTVHDGEIESTPVDKVIMLKYTFIEFEIPSGFTPNGDRANDTWIISRPGGGLEEMDDALVSVYNKQGVLVFRSRGFDRAWDGTKNGEPLPADTYFFTIDLQLRNKKTYKGIVTILR